jgi:hypothetical protein
MGLLNRLFRREPASGAQWRARAFAQTHFADCSLCAAAAEAAHLALEAELEQPVSAVRPDDCLFDLFYPAGFSRLVADAEEDVQHFAERLLVDRVAAVLGSALPDPDPVVFARTATVGSIVRCRARRAGTCNHPAS